MRKKNSAGILVLIVIAHYLLCASFLKAENSAGNDYILEETNDFSISYPSDWRKKTQGEILMFIGPASTEEGSAKSPFIIVRKEDDENILTFHMLIKDSYMRQDESPKIKNMLSEILQQVFQRSYPKDRFDLISYYIEEKADVIMLHVISLDREKNIKSHSVDFITKDDPIKSYGLIYGCIEENFDKYLPTFERTLEGFDIKT